MIGTVHLIHKLDNQWMFMTHEQVGKDIIPRRYPFIHNDKSIEDGQEIIGEIINIGGVEYVKQKFNS